MSDSSLPNWDGGSDPMMEQAEAATKSTANLTAIFYKTLVENGVPPLAAAAITQTWVETQFTPRAPHGKR